MKLRVPDMVSKYLVRPWGVYNADAPTVWKVACLHRYEYALYRLTETTVQLCCHGNLIDINSYMTEHIADYSPNKWELLG